MTEAASAVTATETDVNPLVFLMKRHKKMRQKKTDTSGERAGNSTRTAYAHAAPARQHTPPVFKQNKAGAYIEFHAFDPERGTMRRKLIKVNRVKGAKNRRAYAQGVIIRLNEMLTHGWNPWIRQDIENLHTLEDGLTCYEIYVEKMHADGLYRRETYAGYKSNIKMLRLYVKDVKPCHYMYQFNRAFCCDFLDWIFIERNNTPQTRNNYLNFLRVLSGYFVEKGYLQQRPTDSIKTISKRLWTKGRTEIPPEIVQKIADDCRDNAPHSLLACPLLYYCFIRPVEMTRLRVRDFNLQTGVIVISAENAKNRKTEPVTLPRHVIHHALDLGIFSAPLDHFIFSTKLRPGKEQIAPKIFRDHWEKLRSQLRLDRKWKFYSLKDTGISEMCHNKIATIAVRDQARHSSLSITELYASHADKVNPELTGYRGSL